MTRFNFRTAATAFVLAAVSVGSIQAENNSPAAPAPFRGDGAPMQAYQHAAPTRGAMPVSGGAMNASAQVEDVAPAEGAPGPAPARIAPGYPYLNAPLYSCPRQDVPYQVGGTVYTNQAFFPHEMLYAHEYKAMYPPFYYRARGGWIVTPFGVRSHEHWKLQGTVVKVKYRSHYGWLSGFHPPVIR